MNRSDKLKRLVRIFTAHRTHATLLPYPPLRIWLETTNQCNLRCKVCPNATDTTSRRGNIDPDLYRKIIAQLAGNANDLNLSHRGEPLFHPQLEELVTVAHAADLGTRIHTNATMLDAERTEKLLAAQPDLLSFSFDGYDKKTYEAIRIGGIFEQTLANISYFLKRKRELQLEKPYTIIQIIEPVNASVEYVQELQAFGDRILAMGLDKFYVKKPHNWAGNAPGEVHREAGFTPCTFLYYSMTVLWDGTVCPCPQDWYGTMPLGNLNHQSIDEVWNGKAAVEFRRRMANHDLSGLLCENCDRIYRPNVLGIPKENIKAFLGETVAGYNLVRKLIRR